MTRSIIRTATIALAAVALTATAPAHAADNGSGPRDVSMKDLEDQGYTCQVVATDYYECKKGGKTWTCSDHGNKCVEGTFLKPTRPPVLRPPVVRPPTVPGPVVVRP